MRKYGCFLAAALCLLFVLPFTGCTRRAEQKDEEENSHEICRMAFVTDSVGEAATDATWTLLQQTAEECGVQLTLMEVQSQADKTSAALDQASDGLYDTVIVDRLSNEAGLEWLRKNAGYYPDIQYLCLDVQAGSAVSIENVSSVRWDTDAAYYFYGAFAALQSDTGTVAFLADESGARTERAFLYFYAGASEQDDAVRALYYTVGKETAELEKSLEAAITAEADVFCTVTQPVFDGISEHFAEQEDRPVILAADLSVRENVRQLPLTSGFSFAREALQKSVFRDCCSRALPPEGYIFDWPGGKLRVWYAEDYTSQVVEETRREIALLQQKVIAGQYADLPVEQWSEAEIQNRISAAGEILP